MALNAFPTPEVEMIQVLTTGMDNIVNPPTKRDTMKKFDTPLF
jgi:hypothetical protein